MGKPKKVIRTKSIYKKRRIPPKLLSRGLLVLMFLLLIGVGYLVMRGVSPWLNNGESSQKSSSSSPSGNSSSSGNSSKESSAPSSEPPAAVQSLEGIQLTPEDMQLTGTALQQRLHAIGADGYTAVVLPLKSEDGMIHFATANELAQAYGAVSSNAVDLTAFVQATEDAALSVIGRLSALKDPILPHVSRNNSYAYQTPDGPNWLDNSPAQGGKAWLNPYMDDARKYICDLVREVRNAGVMTIILDNVIFPEQNTGELNTIKTEPSRAQILKQLLDEAQTAASDAAVYQGVNGAVFLGLDDQGSGSGPAAAGYTRIAPVIDFYRYGIITKNANGSYTASLEDFDPARDAKNTVTQILGRIKEAYPPAELFPILVSGEQTVATQEGLKALEDLSLKNNIVE